MNIKKIISCIVFIMVSQAGYAQSAKNDCENNIEMLRKDLLSMLNKIPAMPPVAKVYSAAKDRLNDLTNMKNDGKYSECVSESERVLRITRPYGSR